MSGPINLLARWYRLEVSGDGTDGSWLRVNGLNDLNASITPNNVSADDYESDGWSSFEITMQGWKVSAKVNAKATAGALDPALVLLINCIGEFGDTARVYVRWYRKDGIAAFPAWSGRAIVEVLQSKTGVADLDEQQITLTGDGKPTKISNPYAPTSAPTVSSATPSGATAGSQVTITGSGFTGTLTTAGVKFGGVSSANYTVLGDSTIVAVMPAGSAGSAAVTVTNATGTSNALPYTRG